MANNFGNVGKGVSLQSLGSPPSSPVNGDVWYESGVGFQFREEGSTESLGGGGGSALPYSWGGEVTSGTTSVNTVSTSYVSFSTPTGMAVTQRYNSNFTTPTYKATGVGLTFTAPFTGTIRVGISLVMGDSGAGCSLRIIDGSAAVISEHAQWSGGVAGQTQYIEGFLSITSGMSYTIEVQGKTAASNCVLYVERLSYSLQAVNGLTSSITNTGSLNEMVVVRDLKTAGTAGGTFTSGAWQKRDLNTLSNPNSYVWISLGSSQITLAAGTYLISASAPAYAVNYNALRLRDTTNSVTLLSGQTTYASSGDSVQVSSFLCGTFTLAGSAVLELQHQCNTTGTTTGFGLAINGIFAVATEVFSIVELTKIA